MQKNDKLPGQRQKSLHIENLDPRTLKPYERNARAHGEEDVDAIRASIRQFGFSDPIGIWSDENIIVEGHGRQLAAIAEGLETVPCIRLDHLTDAERKAYGLAHNKTAELSRWDKELLEMELDEIPTIDMSQFGIAQDADLPSYDEMFIEAEEKEPKPRTHICPHCGAKVEV